VCLFGGPLGQLVRFQELISLDYFRSL
jgi:hypothetical protein